jgi:hypothetical protein
MNIRGTAARVPQIDRFGKQPPVGVAMIRRNGWVTPEVHSPPTHPATWTLADLRRMGRRDTGHSPSPRVPSTRTNDTDSASATLTKPPPCVLVPSSRDQPNHATSAFLVLSLAPPAGTAATLPQSPRHAAAASAPAAADLSPRSAVTSHRAISTSLAFSPRSFKTPIPPRAAKPASGDHNPPLQANRSAITAGGPSTRHNIVDSRNQQDSSTASTAPEEAVVEEAAGPERGSVVHDNDMQAALDWVRGQPVSELLEWLDEVEEADGARTAGTDALNLMRYTLLAKLDRAMKNTAKPAVSPTGRPTSPHRTFTAKNSSSSSFRRILRPPSAPSIRREPGTTSEEVMLPEDVLRDRRDAVDGYAAAVEHARRANVDLRMHERRQAINRFRERHATPLPPPPSFAVAKSRVERLLPNASSAARPAAIATYEQAAATLSGPAVVVPRGQSKAERLAKVAEASVRVQAVQQIFRAVSETVGTLRLATLRSKITPPRATV